RMLEPPQEKVTAAQRRGICCLQAALQYQAVERSQNRGGLQMRVAAAVNELQHLHDKFDFANTAAAQLDVVVHALAAHLLLDLALEVAQRIDGGEIEIAAVAERAQDGQQAGTLLHSAGNRAYLDHCKAFPVAALGMVILFDRIDRQRKAAVV